MVQLHGAMPPPLCYRRPSLYSATMFERLRKTFGAGVPATLEAWAAPQRWRVLGQLEDARFSIEGTEETGGINWRIERDAAARDFIQGAELRGRCEAGAPDAGLALKIVHHKRAYVESWRWWDGVLWRSFL